MSAVKVGLVGMGRIGRNLLRILYRDEEIEIAAIDEIADPAGVEYLIRFDTILGRFPEELSIREGNLYVVGRQIPVLANHTPTEWPWEDLGVDVVVEATGVRRSRGELERHIECGARRVLLCAPPRDEPDLTAMVGVNEDQIGPQHLIISNASCTAHCAAPILKMLEAAFGLERAFLTTVHAYTNQQQLADVPAEDPRRGRAAAENIIPQRTNAAHVVTDLLPRLRGKVTGQAISVPVPNGSVVDLVCWHERSVTETAVNEVIRTAVAADWQNIVHYEDDPIVSSDVIRSAYSSTFDAPATMVMADRVSKTLSWFDNSWGYTHRVVDLIRYLARLDGEEAA